MDCAGSNAWLQLGMIEHPLLDPGFWTIIQTFRSARDCGDREHVERTMADVAHGELVLPDTCITVTLITRLQTLGWHVTPNGLLSDAFGTFGLFEVSLAELVLRAQWAWQHVVAEQVSHREGFCDLHFADAADTRSFLNTLPADEQVLFHKCLNGCHITQDARSYCQEGGSKLCPYCMCTDSRFHRFWVCEQFASARTDVPADVWKLLVSAPEYLTCYGWSVRPYTFHSWYQALANVQAPMPPPLPCLANEVHVFTDGSCLNQSFPSCRLAAWAVVLADADH